MNTRLSILPALIAACTLTLPLQAQNTKANPAQLSKAMYQQGLAAENAGQADVARQAYLKALKLDPRNANARYRLGVVKNNYESIASKGRKAELTTVVIPEFKVQDATLKESLTALQMLVEKESSGKLAPNFIIQDNTGSLAGAKVSLVMNSTPAGGLLDHLLSQAGGKARFDEYAIVITPR